MAKAESKRRANEIGYMTDLCKPYADSLKKAKTLEKLLWHVSEWELLAPDAFDSAHSPNFSWDKYAAGLAKERLDIYAGDEWGSKYGAIVMPEVLMRIAIIAQQYLVPDGCIFIRLQQTGQLEVANGRAKLLAGAADREGRERE